MTVNPLAAAPARPARRRRFGVAATAWIIGVSLALTPAVASSATAAPAAGAPQSATPTPSPTPTAPTDPTLTASAFGGGLVPSGTDPVFSVRLRNDTAQVVPASEIVVALSRSALPTSAAVTAWLDRSDDDPTAGAAFDEVARAATADLSASEERTTNVSVSAEGAALAALAPGVYPVAVSLAGEQTRTVITVPQPDAAARPTAVVVPITAGPLTAGLLTRDELDDLTAPDGRLTAMLDAVAGTSAILAIDPAVLAAIRVLGASAPENAIVWLETLLTLPNERFALQFGDADLAAQVHAGLPGLLTPTTLTPYLAEGAFPDAAKTPDLATLTDVGAPVSTVLWPASGSAGADVVTALDAQVAGASVLVPSDTVTDLGTGVRAAAGDADLIVYDATVSSTLARAAELTDTTDRGAELSAATAYATLTGAGPLFTVVDRPAGTSRAALRGAITAITGLPGAAPFTLADVEAAAPAPTSIIDIPASESRVSALSGFLASETSLADFATVLVEPTQITARERASILQVMGNAWRADADAWAAAVSDHVGQTADTLDAVAIVNPGTINFFASSAPISVTVRNDLRWPVAVRLDARSDDPRLIVAPSTEVAAGADQNTRVDVPVEARMGSGEATLQLRLWSTAGVAIGADESVALTVRAEWESIGITITVVVVVILIAGGVVRTVLKLRRRRGRPASDARIEPAEDDA